MDFYLSTNTERIHFPINPETISADTGARIETFTSIELGEIGLPRGTKIARISFEGFFPGEARKDYPFVKSWRKPNEILHQLQIWRNEGQKLRLMITETPLNVDVYIEDLRHEYKGGYGDIHYQLSLVEAREHRVYTDASPRPRTNVGPLVRSRPVPPPPNAYVVKPGDTLYAIAKRYLGDGMRYNVLYSLNREVIGPDPNRISPGMVLRIPGGERTRLA